MEQLKKLIKQECNSNISDEILDMLLARTEAVEARAGECLVDAGMYSPCVWIVKRGIIRLVDMDGGRERTAAFALPGTIFTLKHCYVKDLPSYYEMWGCTDCEMLRVSRDDFEELLLASHPFAVWMYHYLMEELFFQEKKNSSVANGPAIERFAALYRHRPEIIREVPQKHIASYLGISPEYLCRLKRRMSGRH